ncbi:hypothetical protein SAY86_006663 [Trapa natans]|uniref:Cyclin N-terminal domain-containing protein n=1 Tax=Trapa natans TaxID=22666 RepID=A0AAN7QX02_TRANT|nr:hypothetical protein SAY86_006663 [Trapa natans]
MMAGSNENNPGVIGLANLQSGPQAGGKAITGSGQKNRRALSNINRNIIGAAPYPCAFNKRLLPEKNVLCDRNRPAAMHRPITRQFAAQMASRQKNKPGDTKRLIHIEPDLADCCTVDVDDYNMCTEYPAPMFIQHTEAMLEEIDRMDEVGMEDVDEFPPVDIDSGDKSNSLAVVEYIDDLYSYYKKAEGTSCVPPNYMEQQFDINERMRGILIDWLIEVHYKFELMDETLYLMVNLIDRFLAAQPIVRKKLQLVGVTAMLLACKYEEVSVPVVEDLILISDKAYTRKEVLDMERLVVNTLQFNMSVPTPYVFMRRFLKAAYSDKKLEMLSFFIIELCLVEYATLRFPPSLLAAAAVYTAQCTISRIREWSRACEFHSTYTEEQLLECSKMMVTFHQKAATGKLTGVHRKYSTSKFGYAARAEPASFLLEGSF